MPKNLSVKNTRRRIQRTAKRSRALGERDIAILVDSGQMKPVEDWDLEELSQGRPRGKNGKFNGPAPQWISAKVKEEIRRRLGEGAVQEMAKHLPAAVKILWVTINDPDVSAKDRYPYLQLLFERVLGKPAIQVDLLARTQVEDLLADVVVLEDGRPAHPVIDGQFYDEAADVDAEVKEIRAKETRRPKRDTDDG